MTSIPGLGTPARTVLLFLSVALFSLGTVASSEIGLAWDEANFIPSGIHYLRAVQEWLRNPSDEGLGADPRWEWTWEHPPLVKLGSAVSLGLLARSLGPLVAARMPMLLLLGLLPVGAFLLGRELAGESAGLWSALLTACSPRLVGHLMVVGLDGPLAVLSLFFLSLLLRDWDRDWGFLRGGLLLGLLLGLCLLVKFNAFFLVPVALVRCFRSKNGSGTARLLLILSVALAVGYLGYPFLWHETGRRVSAYFLSKLQRSSVPVYYLGTTYGSHESGPQAPWHYPLALLWATTPPLVVLSVFAGSLSPVWRRDVPPVLVLAASFLLPCCAPPTPKYDGIRLFLPAAAGLAVMGGMGMDRVARWLESVLRIPTPLTALGVSLLSAGSLVSVHPHYLSYYSPTVGGLPGAERLGFELTYWGECLGPEVLRTLNEEHGVRLLLADPVGGNVCPLSERMGLVPEDMKMRRLAEGAGEGPAARTTKEGTAVALVCRQGKFDEGLWRLYRRETPFKTVSAGDTALVRFYTQEQWDRAQGSGSGEVRP